MGLGDEDGYYEIYPNGKDGGLADCWEEDCSFQSCYDQSCGKGCTETVCSAAECSETVCQAVTVYCDLTLGADYYVCDGCNEFWQYSPSEWLSTNALSYSFDWHPGVGQCDGGERREVYDAGSLEECWEACMPDDDDDDDNDYYGGQHGMGRFVTQCVSWQHDSSDHYYDWNVNCYCNGMWSNDDSLIDASDNCVQQMMTTDDVDDSWGVAVPRGTVFPGGCDDGYNHECPTGMEPIIPRSREHWARSVSSWHCTADVVVLVSLTLHRTVR